MRKILLSISLILSVLFSSVAVLAKVPLTVENISIERQIHSKEILDRKNPKDYEKYLTKLGRNEPEALNVKEQFSKLSPEKKKKFMHYITNPKILIEALETPLEENSTKALYNGDIVVKRKTVVKVVDIGEGCPEKDEGIFSKVTSFFVGSVFAAPSRIYEMSVQDQQELALLGIRTSKFTAWVKYKSKDKRTVESVIEGDGYHSNFVPIRFTKESVTKYVYGNKAHTAIVWKVTQIVDPFDYLAYNWHHHVLGYADGKQTYRFYRDW